MLQHAWYLIKLLFSKKKKFYYFLYRTLGFIPSKIYLFEIAFIHKSASVESNGQFINNERLEFLGDAILDAVIAEYLYKRYPDKDEGYLTKFKSKIVNRDHLNNIAINLEINQFVVAQSSNFHNIKYINGNAFEALIGALFLDKGYNRTRKFIVDKLLKKRVDVESLKTIDNDFKSMLIEWGQKYKREIIFNTEEDFQSKDAIPWFISDILIESKKFGTGKGKSKKEAEQNASKDALTRIKDNKPINM